MVAFYMDVHIPGALTEQLRHRGIDVLTAQEDGTGEWEDTALLDRAGELGRVLVTQDQDFLREAALRQGRGELFAGIIFAAQSPRLLGVYVRNLELIALASEPEEYADRVRHLPL